MHSYMAILEHIQVPNFSAYWAINMQQCMFCHLVTLWLPRWFSAKIFACDFSLGKKMFWNHFDGWKTRQRHGVHAFFLYLPWFLSYLQHCHKTENRLMIKHYRKVLQRRWDNWILPFRYGVLLTFLRLNITRIKF